MLTRTLGFISICVICLSFQACGATKSSEPNTSDAILTNQPHEFLFVQKNGKYGFINLKGEITIQPQFDGAAATFSEGLASVCVGTCDFIDSKEKGADKFADKTFEGKFGFVDTKGQMVINPQFSSVGEFSQGLAYAATGTYKLIGELKYGFIDKTGKFVIPEQFDNRPTFDESGTAPVCVGEGKTKRCGYIDKTGKYVINPQYFNAFGFGRDSVAAVVNNDGDSVSWIDRGGKMIWKGEPEPTKDKE